MLPKKCERIREKSSVKLEPLKKLELPWDKGYK
jgi:hypothetical protein